MSVDEERRREGQIGCPNGEIFIQYATPKTPVVVSLLSTTSVVARPRRLWIYIIFVPERRTVKKAKFFFATMTSPAFANAGREAGVEVWRIENMEPVAWPKEQYGQFYSGDSYIVLHTIEVGSGLPAESPCLSSLLSSETRSCAPKSVRS